MFRFYAVIVLSSCLFFVLLRAWHQMNDVTVKYRRRARQKRLGQNTRNPHICAKHKVYK